MTFYQIVFFFPVYLLHGFLFYSWNMESDMFQSLNHVDVNLKLRFLAKSGHYIVPSPSTALVKAK